MKRVGGTNLTVNQDSYSIRPSFKDKFRPNKVKAVIKEIVDRQLFDVKYEHEKVAENCRALSEQIRNDLRSAQPRYKIMVQVVIGDKKGQGVRIGSRCFWDSDTDNMATYTYTNETLFCVVVVFACYLY